MCVALELRRDWQKKREHPNISSNHQIIRMRTTNQCRHAAPSKHTVWLLDRSSNWHRIWDQCRTLNASSNWLTAKPICMLNQNPTVFYLIFFTCYFTTLLYLFIGKPVCGHIRHFSTVILGEDGANNSSNRAKKSKKGHWEIVKRLRGYSMNAISTRRRRTLEKILYQVNAVKDMSSFLWGCFL